jgi:hypothetical protein
LRSHAAGEPSPNGCRPSSYVEISAIFTMPHYSRLRRNPRFRLL